MKTALPFRKEKKQTRKKKNKTKNKNKQNKNNNKNNKLKENKIIQLLTVVPELVTLDRSLTHMLQ